MSVLADAQRRTLDKAVQRAREVAEAAAREAVSRLAVDRESRPDYLSGEENDLRLALREKARLLGDETGPKPELKLLIGDIAYEQWHRLLFARFLEVNGLLRHPDVPDVALTMDDCAELATEEGEPDGWSVAAKYAEKILPGVFRSSDPAVRLRFSPERRAELDAIVAALDRATLIAEDALGWVYQFWQTTEKKRVNESGRKIGGADLAPVTQLFTENYMVRFLLENSLGAWWAGRHPDSPLLAEWEYLRRLDDGTPAAGTFDEWPKTAAEVTVMDPCCGSGHFLVAAFGMLWQMRAEEEGLSDAEAQDAVLRDNLFGLELDPRCTQIAAFNVILEAWKQGRFRDLPELQLAPTGNRVELQESDFPIDPAKFDSDVAFGELKTLFHRSHWLGSLMDSADSPRSRSHRELLSKLRSTTGDPNQNRGTAGSIATAVRTSAVHDLATAVTLLSKRYVLVVTNPPFLGADLTDEPLSGWLNRIGPAGRNTATAFVMRCVRLATHSAALVSMDNWRFLRTYTDFRTAVQRAVGVSLVAAVGSKAFSVAMWDFPVSLWVFNHNDSQASCSYIDATASNSPRSASRGLLNSTAGILSLDPGDGGWVPPREVVGTAISAICDLSEGTKPGQTTRATRFHWEVPATSLANNWDPLASSPSGVSEFSGMQEIILKQARLRSEIPESNNSGGKLRGQPGVLIQKMGSLHAAIYLGSAFDNNTFVAVPRSTKYLAPLWHFIKSPEFAKQARTMNQKLDISLATFGRTTIDLEKWSRIAEENGALPEPHSDDPTQWLFKGTIPNAAEPLQVAVARLLGYRWPDQEPDDLDALADNDGIVALPALTGELDAATRLRALLSRSYGAGWSTQREQALIQQACGKRIGLAEWLRDEFFKQHTKVFHQRPFLWHIWDGRKDGFAAIVNYHRLDRRLLEKLAFTVLGSWIEKQRTDAANDIAGADLRLAAATDLRRKLELILSGEPPYDIYVRWKTLAEQPIGWEPDLDDGVRLNIRPFVTAEVLRSRVNVSWKKDRGTNPDGSERLNDLHPTLAERRAARSAAGLGR